MTASLLPGGPNAAGHAQRQGAPGQCTLISPISRAGCFALPLHTLHTWLAAALCRACPGGSRACHLAPFTAGPIEQLLHTVALWARPCDLAVHATGVGVSLPHPLGSTGAPPAPGPCRAGSPARASAVQPLSIGSAVSCGLCPVSRRRPSIPQSFRRSPAAAPHRHPRAASVRPAPAASSRPAEALWLRTKPFFLAEGHGVGERTFFPEPKTGSAGSWPALS